MTGVGQAASRPSNGTSNSRSLLLHVKDSLAHSAAAYTNRGRIRLHVLFSTPRSAKDLYPFAHIDASDASKTNDANPIEAFVEHIIMTASWGEEEQGEEAGHYKQGRLMYALECFLYTLPKQKASLLYVSKLDSSGWGPTPTPKHLQALTKPSSIQDSSWDNSTSITRVITRAFLSYFASLSHWSSSSTLPAVRHCSIHILARAQGAYLFPASNDNKGKHVLSDGALIKWWRSVVSSVVCGVRRRKGNGTTIEARPFYLIPGYDRLESHELLPLPPPSAIALEPNDIMPFGNQALAEAGWVYGHPYSYSGAGLDTKTTSNLPPLPLSGPSFQTQGNPSFHPDQIAMLLPHFPDDPKSRFIAEIARDSYEHAALPKRKAESNLDEEKSDSAKKVKIDQSEDTIPSSDGKKDEMAAVVVTSLISKAMRERGALDRVSSDEFWTRMGFRQECCAGNAVGVFVTLFTRRGEEQGDAEASQESEEASAMSGQNLALPHPTLPDLVRKHLMRDACDWSQAEGSRDLTKAWDDGVERAIKRKGGAHSAENGSELGLDVVYSEVILLGPTKEELAAAERKWKEAEGSKGSIENGATVTHAPINTLSVKRKKKV